MQNSNEAREEAVKQGKFSFVDIEENQEYQDLISMCKGNSLLLNKMIPHIREAFIFNDADMKSEIKCLLSGEKVTA